MEQVLQILLTAFCADRVVKVSTYQTLMADFGGYKTIRAELDALQDLDLIELRKDDHDRRALVVWPMQSLITYYNGHIPGRGPANA